MTALLFLSGCLLLDADDLADRLADTGGPTTSTTPTTSGDDADGDGWAFPEDCDDADDRVHPAAAEVCNGKDDDCDEAVDDADGDVQGVPTWYADGDGDGWGNEQYTAEACARPAEHADRAGDCDDADGSVNPGAVEVCGNGVDDDCSGGANACLAEGGVVVAEDLPLRQGQADYDGLGDTVGVGELTGDGLADLVITARDSEDNDVGAAYVVPGPLVGGGSVGVGSVRYRGGAAGDGLGSAVAVADVDGEGVDDLWVGASFADVSTGGGEGQAALFLAPHADRSVTGADLRLLGSSLYGSLGASVGTLGDQDGDGLPELVAGAPLAGEVFSGVVRVVPGTTRGSGEELGVALTLEVSGASLGTAVVGLGDVNGDGVDDLAVAAPFLAVGSTTGAGVTYVMLGPVLGGPVTDADATWTGVSKDDRAGTSLAAAELDGDGHRDLVVAGWPVNANGTDSGAAYLVADVLVGGSLATASAVLIGNSAGDHCGGSAASLGDLDGNGADELLVGAKYAGETYPSETQEGRAYLVAGPVAGVQSVLAAASLEVEGSTRDGLTGWAVTGGPDLTGDGLADLAVASPAVAGGGRLRGEVHLLAATNP